MRFGWQSESRIIFVHPITALKLFLLDDAVTAAALGREEGALGMEHPFLWQRFWDAGCRMMAAVSEREGENEGACMQVR